MAGNTFGTFLRLTTFGESHGLAVGGILDGLPAGLTLDQQHIQLQLNRRKPGQSAFTSPRKEEDVLHFASGIFQGKTTGTPLAFWVLNQDQRSEDYDHLKEVYRPSHADYTYHQKYKHIDTRGGGRASARETLARVAAGAIAQQLLQAVGINLRAYVSAIGNIKTEKQFSVTQLHMFPENALRCPDDVLVPQMAQLIESVKLAGDSIGGQISCIIEGCPVGLGEPVFDKLNADLAKAMFSIQAVKGFELGSGFSGSTLRGSEHNDAFIKDASTQQIRTKTNHSGGIQGGISNGEPIYFTTAFKPVSTIAQKQQTLNKIGEAVELTATGRHDPCVVPRAVPIVEAMAALVLADHYLRAKAAAPLLNF